MMEWHAIPRERAKKIVAAGMNCNLIGEGLRISAVSECLRAMSHLCSVPEAEKDVWEPAASVRLTGMLRRRLAPLWPKIVGDGEDSTPGAMGVLESLAELGDMVRLEGGRWLAAPAHLVRVEDGLAILLGGGPLETLPQEVAGSARVAGRVRLVEQRTCDGWADLWEMDDWIGISAESLEEWSIRLLDGARMRLAEAPNEMGDASAYLRRQWVRLADLPKDTTELILCRVRVAQTPSYFVGELIRGRLRRLSAISSQDARRLRFHFDVKSGSPIKVVVHYSSQGIIKLQLGFPLPKREARVLHLGWQVSAPENERSFGVHYEFPIEALPVLRRTFEWLGIILDERFGARRGT